MAVILMALLGIFIIFNLAILAMFVLTIVFGVLYATKKKYKKAFIVLLVCTIVFAILDAILIFYILSNMNG